MLTTAIETPTKAVSPTVPKPSPATGFAEGVRVFVEEYRLAKTATVLANERHSLPAVRALYVPTPPKAVQ